MALNELLVVHQQFKATIFIYVIFQFIIHALSVHIIIFYSCILLYIFSCSKSHFTLIHHNKEEETISVSISC